MTDDAVVIRPAIAADVPRLGELGGQLVRLHHAADPRRFMLFADVETGYGRWLGGEIRAEGSIVLVATLGAEVVGYAYATVEGRDWNMLLDEHGALRDILVDEAHRRGGVGAKLLAATLAELERRGRTRVVLSTMVGNEAAQRLFAKHGFRPTMLEMTRGG